MAICCGIRVYNLFISKAIRETERIILLLVHCPNGPNHQGWNKLKLEARNSTKVYVKIAETQVFEPVGWELNWNRQPGLSLELIWDAGGHKAAASPAMPHYLPHKCRVKWHL